MTIYDVCEKAVSLGIGYYIFPDGGNKKHSGNLHLTSGRETLDARYGGYEFSPRDDARINAFFARQSAVLGSK